MFPSLGATVNGRELLDALIRSRRDRPSVCEGRAAHRGTRFLSQEVRKMCTSGAWLLVHRNAGAPPCRQSHARPQPLSTGLRERQPQHPQINSDSWPGQFIPRQSQNIFSPASL